MLISTSPTAIAVYEFRVRNRESQTALEGHEQGGCARKRPPRVPEKSGSVSSGYILARSHDRRARDTLYRGGSGPWVP